MQLTSDTKIPFIQAKWFTPVNEMEQRRNPRVIVIHDMEAPEKGTTAKSVAEYFASGCDGREASAHYCIDNENIIQCVQCKDVAFGAPGMNRLGIHLEHAGYASQSEADWKDEYSLAMLENSVELCAAILIPKFGIAVKWLTDAQIVNASDNKSISGFCTHADITRAYKTIDSNYPGTHTDPGVNFPRQMYMEMLLSAMKA